MSTITKSAGFVPSWASPWVSTKTYKLYNIVSHRGNSYISTVANNTTEPATVDAAGVITTGNGWDIFAQGTGQFVSQTGESETQTMHQKAISNFLADKFDKDTVVQATGTGKADVMSQKATTDAIAAETTARNAAIEAARTEYNISVLKATSGVDSSGNSGGNLYTLSTALTALNAYLTEVGGGEVDFKKGDTLAFYDKDNSGDTAKYEYLGGTITTASNWRAVVSNTDIASINSDMLNVDIVPFLSSLPTTIEAKNSTTITIEDKGLITQRIKLISHAESYTGRSEERRVGKEC